MGDVEYLTPTEQKVFDAAKLCDQLVKDGSFTDKHLEDLKDVGCELNDELEEVDPQHLEKLKADLDNLNIKETEDQACQSLGGAVKKGGAKIVSAIFLGYLHGIGQGLGLMTVQRAEQGFGGGSAVKKSVKRYSLERAFRDYINQQGEASNSNGLETINNARSDDAQQANGQRGFSAIGIADDVVNRHFVRN